MPFKDINKRNQYDREYRKKHRKQTSEKNRKWKLENKDKIIDYGKRYRKSGKGKLSYRRYRKKLRMDVLTHYGGNPPRCSCCGENEIRFLTIDHVHGDGKEQKKTIGITGRSGHGDRFYRWLRQNDYPDIGLQVMCYNCNCSKGDNDKRFCPVHHPELY